MKYEELFQRNYGIFSRDEQERIRRSSILIVGCGGIGATVAIILARSGVSRFVLVDYDLYEPTNMNRQIACFVDTLGRNKAEVVKEHILRINPEAEVEAYEWLSHSEIAELIPRVDLVFPAADNFSFSVFVFRDARRLGKTALMVVPSGTWANVSLIPPDGPSPEDIEGVPKLGTYEELRDTLEIRKYRFGLYFYVPFADWRIDYFRGFVEEGFQPTQICAAIWFCSSLGALEALKFLSGKWRPVASPRYWYITRDKIRINRINGPCLYTLLVWQRRFMWWVFQTRFGPFQEKLQSAWWRLYYQWVKRCEERRYSHPVRISFRPSLSVDLDLDYRTLYQRNYGVFTEAEQERIRHTRVLIVGDAGTGETISVILARCGVEEFIISGKEVYVSSDMNRQICCFLDTIGRNKVSQIREAILSINPNSRVTTHGHLPSEEEMDQLVCGADIVIPAVDDLAYSVLVFRAARRHRKPAVFCLPSGSMGWVSVFREKGPTIEKVLGIPEVDYEGMSRVIHSKGYQCARYRLVTAGDWRVDWFWEYFKGNRPLALFCPVEWMMASLAALETLKIASGKWKPKEAPRCWYMKKGRISASRFSRFVRYHRKLGWLVFGQADGKPFHKRSLWFWSKFFNYLKTRQNGRKY